MTASSIPDLVQELNNEAKNNNTEVTALNTQPLGVNNETIVDIEQEGGSRRKGNEARLLKDAVCTDQALHSAGLSECDNVPQTVSHVDYGSRRDRNPVWVQFMGDSDGMDDSRGPFIQIVFAILFVCLLVTFIFVVCTFLVPGVRSFFAGPGFLLCFVGTGMVIVASYKLMCYEYGRQPPCSWFGILFAVIGECLVLGALTARFRLGEILLALGTTCILVVICFALAFTPLDFTKCYIYLIIIGIALSVFCAVVMVATMVLGQRFVMLRLVLCGCFIVYQAVCLVMEIQLILGGGSVELGEDDYIVGAFMMYTSIIGIFIQILQAIGLLEMLGADDFF